MCILAGIKGAWDRGIEAATLHWSLVPGVASAPQTPHPRPQHYNPQHPNPHTLALGDLVRRASKPRPQVPDHRRVSFREAVYTLAAGAAAGAVLWLCVQHAIAASDTGTQPPAASDQAIEPSSHPAIQLEAPQNTPSDRGPREAAPKALSGPVGVIAQAVAPTGPASRVTPKSIALAALQRREGITYTHGDGEELAAVHVGRTRTLGAMEPRGSRPTWARATGIRDQAPRNPGGGTPNPSPETPNPHHARRNI